MHPGLRHYYYYSSSSEAAPIEAAEFQTRVEADSGTFESLSCLQDNITELGSFFDDATFVLMPNGVKLAKIYAVKPSDGSADLAFTRATTAYRQGPTAMESKAVNYPRISHLGSDCPSLLLELARTNLLLRSQEFDNASWTKSTATVTANATTGPDGTSIADKIVEDSTAGVLHGISQSVSKATSSLFYSTRYIVKKGERSWVRVALTDASSNGYHVWFNLDTGARGSFLAAGTGFTLVDYDIIELNDGYYLCSLLVRTSTTNSLRSYLMLATGDAVQTYNGDGASGVYCAGADLIQAESPNTNSYFATTTASAARALDAVTALTGQSALIGQTEGTIYFRFKSWADGIAKHVFFISDGTANNRIGLFIQTTDKMHCSVSAAGVTQANIASVSSLKSNIWYDVVITYQANKVAFFFNGTKIGEDLSVTVPACSVIEVGVQGGTFRLNGEFEKIAFSKTALSDEAAETLSLKNYTAKRFDFFYASTQSKYASNPVLLHDATYTNTCPSGIVTDPLDSTKFLFYRGEFIGGDSADARITLFIGNKSNPYDLSTYYGVVFQGSESYDINGCRFAFHPVLHNGLLYYYYVGINASMEWKICLATSADGRTYTKQGVVLDFNSVDEFGLSGPSVIKDGDTWYMVYTAWDGVSTPDAPNDPGKSIVGIKGATSSDGITWTKNNLVMVPLNMAFDNAHVEDGELKKYGDTFVIRYSCAGLSSNPWGTGLAYSKMFNSQFKKISSRYLSGGGTGAWDEDLVACWQSFDFGEGIEIGYYQAHAEGEAGQNDIGAVDLTMV